MKDLHTHTASASAGSSSAAQHKCCKMRIEKPDRNCNCQLKKEPVSGEELEALLAEADRLAGEHLYEAQYQLLLPYRGQDCDELLWRLAQACCGWAKVLGEKGDQHKKKAHMEEGFAFADRALKINDRSANCHSWYATMLHYTSESQGLKQHYLNAFVIRDHYQKAVALNPSDSVSLHSLGYWCFEFAHLPWYQKKILALLFKTPPSTTFQQALDYFHKAEEATPGFFNMNLVMTGRAHHSLHQYDKARDYFTRALNVAPKSPDERLAHAKATEMLKKMDHHHH